MTYKRKPIKSHCRWGPSTSPASLCSPMPSCGALIFLRRASPRAKSSAAVGRRPNCRSLQRTDLRPLEAYSERESRLRGQIQGQQAPVVIYSLTTSSPEDAPRGMEFLYSLNRLNVASSRAQAVVIVVVSPRLLEPECRNPRQMQLASALCRNVEVAQVIEWPRAQRNSARMLRCPGRHVGIVEERNIGAC